MKGRHYDFLTNVNKPPTHVNIEANPNFKTHFNKNMNYYICSFGGSGSTVLFQYLSNFGNVYHIHDRFPPKKLQHIGKNYATEDIYSEWFNKVEIPESDINNYKIIFIYRHPVQVIYSRLTQNTGPNIKHMQHIMCDNNGDIPLSAVLNSRKDLYKLEQFFDNYTIKQERNYRIYCVKYEQFWDNIPFFNNIIGIPDIKELYPSKYETRKPIRHRHKLTCIYWSLINKMNNKPFIELV
jgi:hypothetical protein